MFEFITKFYLGCTKRCLPRLSRIPPSSHVLLVSLPFSSKIILTMKVIIYNIIKIAT